MVDMPKLGKVLGGRSGSGKKDRLYGRYEMIYRAVQLLLALRSLAPAATPPWSSTGARPQKRRPPYGCAARSSRRRSRRRRWTLRHPGTATDVGWHEKGREWTTSHPTIQRPTSISLISQSVLTRLQVQSDPGPVWSLTSSTTSGRRGRTTWWDALFGTNGGTSTRHGQPAKGWASMGLRVLTQCHMGHSLISLGLGFQDYL